MRLKNLAILSLLAWSSVLPAADDNGQFAIKGIGLASCQRFVEDRKAQSPQYYQFGGWLNGFMTAMNRYEPETFDIAPWQSTGLLAALLGHFCQDNPDVPFFRAVAIIVNSVGKERLTTRSERVEAQVDDTTIHIYETVLRQVQEQLSERGHYEGAAAGTFDSQTREALEGFQRKAELEPTGLPDQPTLAKLLN